MAVQTWNRSFDFSKNICISPGALLYLAKAISSFGSQYIYGTVELSDGSSYKFENTEDLESIRSELFAQADEVALFSHSEDLSCRFVFHRIPNTFPSKYAHHWSSWKIETKVENHIFMIRALGDEFQEKFATDLKNQGCDFVSSTVNEIQNYSYNGELDLDETSISDVEKVAEKDADLTEKPLAGLKTREVPTELPSGKLYLEDIDEISRILINAYEAEKRAHSPKPTIKYTIGETVYTSISELSTRGGTIHHFSMGIENGYMRGLNIKGVENPSLRLFGLSKEAEWAVYGKIKQVLDSRSYRLHNIIWSLPTWTAYGLSVLWFLSLQGLDHFNHKSRLLLVGLWLTITALLGLTIFQRSAVVLSTSFSNSKLLSERNRAYVTNMLFTILGAILSLLLQLGWNRWSH